MPEKSATKIAKKQIPSEEWFMSPSGIETRKNHIDSFLMAIHNIRKDIKILEKTLVEQLEDKKEKHNYKEIWGGFDKAYENNKQAYVTTSFEKERYFLTWVKNRNKNRLTDIYENEALTLQSIAQNLGQNMHIIHDQEYRNTNAIKGLTHRINERVVDQICAAAKLEKPIWQTKEELKKKKLERLHQEQIRVEAAT